MRWIDPIRGSAADAFARAVRVNVIHQVTAAFVVPAYIMHLSPLRRAQSDATLLTDMGGIAKVADSPLTISGVYDAAAALGLGSDAAVACDAAGPRGILNDDEPAFWCADHEQLAEWCARARADAPARAFDEDAARAELRPVEEAKSDPDQLWEQMLEAGHIDVDALDYHRGPPTPAVRLAADSNTIQWDEDAADTDIDIQIVSPPPLGRHPIGKLLGHDVYAVDADADARPPSMPTRPST